MYRLCLLIVTGPLTLVLLLVVMVMTAYLAARLSYVQVGDMICFTVINSTQRYVYAQAVTAAVFSGVSFLCVLIMMAVGLSNADTPAMVEN
jgi:hypothetical protein